MHEAPNGSPLVSIVVLNYKGVEVTPQCLRAVYASSYQNVELLIVDNSPDDGSVAASLEEPHPRQLSVRVFAMNRNVGFCRGFNTGIEESSGKYILLLNNDAVVEPAAISNLVAFMEEHPEAGLCEGKIVNTGPNFRGNISNPDIARWAGIFVHAGPPEPDRGQFDGTRELFSAIGVWPFVRREVVEAVGAYDPSFFICNEIRDWCWRIWLAGYTVRYVPGAVTAHVGRLESVTRTYGKKTKSLNTFHEAKNSVQILLKNSSMLTLIWLAPLNIVVRLSEIAWLLASGHRVNAALKIRGYLWIAANLSPIAAERARVRGSIKKVSDRQALHSLRWMNPLQHLRLYRTGDVFSE